MKEPNRNGSKIVIGEKNQVSKKKKLRGMRDKWAIRNQIKGREEKTKRKARTGRSEEEEER